MTRTLFFYWPGRSTSGFVDTPAAEARETLAVTRQRPEAGGDPVVGWALQHAVQTWAAFVFLAFVLKVILETRGNREIALGVLQAADPGSVLLGLVASFLPYLLFTSALALAMLAASSESALVTRALAIVAALVSLLITPAWIALVVLLLLVVVFTAAGCSEGHGGRGKVRPGVEIGAMSCLPPS